MKAESREEHRNGTPTKVRHTAGSSPGGIRRQADVVLSALSVKKEHLPESFNIMERMVERENMKKAYGQVMRNKGAAGIDKMPVSELKSHLQTSWAGIKGNLLEGKHKPSPVRRVEIPKPSGGVRKLGIPTVSDRLIQQSLYQVLEPIFDPTFSESSYGFRRGRSAQGAVRSSKKHAASGKRWVVDIDLEKFFDLVDHDILMARVERKVKDRRVLKLIRKYLKAGVMEDGACTKSRKGTPQGGPLSPLLSNIVLDDLDKELEKRGHQFCRYADDLRVYVGSEKAGNRVMSSLIGYLEKTLKLKVNRSKSQVVQAHKSTFLGYSLTNNKVPKLRVPKESVAKLRAKLKAEFRRGRGRNLGRFIKEDLNKILKGWIHYFGSAEVKSFAKELDGWIRRHLRNIKWRQWKRPDTRMKELMRGGLDREWARISTRNRKGPWWNSGSKQMNYALPKKYFDKLGLVSMLNELEKFQS